jgi:hypothetical protein
MYTENSNKECVITPEEKSLHNVRKYPFKKNTTGKN